MGNGKLIAIKVERRVVAAAVFIGLQLDYTQVRQLSSSPDKAESSALGFVHGLAGMFDVHSVAVENYAAGAQVRRAALTQALIESLRRDGISVWEASKEEVFVAYAIPPLETRKQLREIAASFWPILEDEPLSGPLLDTAALGLYVQVQRKLQS